MYICPECGEEFKLESSISKHYLGCWKANHTPPPAKTIKPISIETREDNQDILNFFNSFN